ncbi:hypothetical protein [Nonomuraea sediminis]|uniref:hypothetical protein n=1 Tax=Nonomuraea sediminis TaxID=2835864 RepID=UPI001BDD4E9A|nr:hypothetical protein [Nonomuraea sediminis]
MATEYTIKPHPIDFNVHGKQHADKVKMLFENLDERGVEKAGNAYTDASTVLKTTLGKIEDAARAMADCWGDQGSVEAQKALQQLHTTIREFTEKADKMGPPLVKLGKEIIPKYKGQYGGTFGWGRTWDAGFSFTDGDDLNLFAMDKDGNWNWFSTNNDQAKDEVQKFSNDLQSIFSSLPDTVREDLPKLGPSGGGPDVRGTDTDTHRGWVLPKYPYTGYDPTSNGGDGSGIDGWPGSTTGGDNGTGDQGGVGDHTGTGNGADTGGTGGGVDGNNGLASGTHPSVTDPSRNTSLSDFHKPKIDPTSYTTPTSTPYSSAHAPTANGGTPVMAPNALDGALDGARTTRLASAGGSMGGMPFVPMTGAGGGQEDELSRDSGAWMAEPDETWRGDTSHTVDHLIT